MQCSNLNRSSVSIELIRANVLNISLRTLDKPWSTEPPGLDMVPRSEQMFQLMTQFTWTVCDAN